MPGYDRKVEFGIIVHFKYPLENSNETIEVATTRPETMLGDSGIAVHPEDPRYTHLVGKFAVHPFIKGRRLPIVADKYVDREFGTGAIAALNPWRCYGLGEMGNVAVGND